MADYKILYCIMFFLCINSTQLKTTEYEDAIKQHALAWKTSYIHATSAQSDIQTIIDVLLLSYQTVRESYNMILAKLSIQEKLLKIYTPSLIDSWQDCIQLEHNNYTPIEHALTTMKNSETVFQAIFKKFKKIAKHIIRMDAEPTQTLISDLKNSLIVWSKAQQNLTQQLVDVQNEFTHAIATISNIKAIFEVMFTSPEIKHAHLQEAAGFVSKTYKDIETVIQHLTTVRKESMYKIDEFFITFFKTYYSIIYYELSEEQRATLTILATENQKLPNPEIFFAA